MFPTTTKFCKDTVYQFNSTSYDDLVNVSLISLSDVCYEISTEISTSKLEGKFSQPMVLIGIYISIASLVCILAMALDLSCAIRGGKYWFPTKYFPLNAMSITVIAVAMKLPVDLSSPMPVAVDQVSKIGGLAFMCTMMSNFMPSLASMDNKSLLANVTGLSIFIITLIVNIFIQIRTHLISPNAHYKLTPPFTLGMEAPSIETIAYIYMGILLCLLIILISTAITIPTSKKILEIKYQAASKVALNDPQVNQKPSVENLNQLVKKYWIMAETGSPQFVVASSSLSFASGIICLFSMVMYITLAWWIFPWQRARRDDFTYYSDNEHDYDYATGIVYSLHTSAYKWSIKVIFLTQTIGIVVGSIAPIGRCFLFLRFKPFANQIKKHLVVYKVDKYWTQKLGEWKESGISFLSSTRRSRVLLRNLKNGILSCFIGFQKVIVVSGKVIGFIPFVLIITGNHCLHYLIIIRYYCLHYLIKPVKAMIFTTLTALSTGHTNTPTDSPSSSGHTNEDLSNYVLLLNDDVQLGEKPMKRISDSMDHFIKKAEKKQHKNLLRLLEQSFEFAGVKTFDTDQFRSPLSVEHDNSWSLAIITLTCIAIVIPKIPKDRVHKLFQSVGEGLLYTHLVEKSLNREPVYVNIRRATLTLWHEVEDKYKWLENTLETSAYEGNTPETIIRLLAQKAEEILNEFNGVPVENLPLKLIAANSMYRIAHTIIHAYRSHSVVITEDELFEELSVMIADILAACLTNIPRVITMRCQESAIEKRESSVVAAADLLGRTTEIINTLRTHVLPDMDPDEMGYIDKWHRHLLQP